MRVWVIMGNDYPAAVCASEKLAEKFVEAMKELEREKQGKATRFGPVIYWRHYSFDLMGDATGTTQGGGVPRIEVSADEVVVCGVRVPRPSGISPGQWYAFWDRETRDGEAGVRAYGSQYGR